MRTVRTEVATYAPGPRSHLSTPVLPRLRRSREKFLPVSVQRLVLCWFALWFAVLLGYEYYVRIEAPAMGQRIELHHQIVTGTAAYQYRYRILIPYAAEGIARGVQHLPLFHLRPAVSPLVYSTRAFRFAYSLLDVAALFVMLASLGDLLRRLFTYELALFGTSLSALLIGFTFRDHYFHPWSLWEGAFFALGLLLIQRKRYWLFTGLTVLGLLNRETSVFLLLAFLFYALPANPITTNLRTLWSRREMRFALGNLAGWTAGFGVLHWVVGYRPATFFIQTAVAGNLERWRYALLLNLIVAGIVLPIAIRGMIVGPKLIRRAALMLPPYFGLLVVIGFWWEIRYWITAIPIVIAALIAGLTLAPKANRDRAHGPVNAELSLSGPGFKTRLSKFDH